MTALLGNKELDKASVVEEGILTLRKNNDEIFNSLNKKVYGRLTNEALYCYKDAQHLTEHHLKLQVKEIKHIYVTGTRHNKFLTIATKHHDNIIMSSLKDKMLEQWRRSLISVWNQYDQYHQKNEDIKPNIDNDHDLPSHSQSLYSDSEQFPTDLQCYICHKLLTNPVKNASASTYCYDCIVAWYNTCIETIKSKDQDTKQFIRDPKKNKPLPQNSLLLIPDFKKLMKIYQYKYEKRIDDKQKRRFEKIDDKLNHYRKKLNQPPLMAPIQQKICQIATYDGMFNHQTLSPIFDEIWKLSRLENKIHIAIGFDVRDWNASFGKSLPYKWKKPNFKGTPAATDKNTVSNAIETFGIDDQCNGALYGLEIEKFVNEVLKVISKEKDEKIAKEKVIKLILTKQEEIMEEHMEENEENEEKHDVKKDIDKQFVELDAVHRVWYEDNMKCTREMMEMIEKREPFELVFEDNKSEMSRNKLIRFLEFSGFKNAHKIQKIVYHKLAEKLRCEILRASAHLKSVSEDTKKTTFWKYLSDIKIANNPDKNRKSYRDCLWFKIKLDLDFEIELNKFDNDTGRKNAEYRLTKEIKTQLMEELGIKNHNYVKMHDMKAGSIDLVIGITCPVFWTVSNAWMYRMEVRADSDPTWKVAKGSAISRCVASTAALGIAGALTGLELGSAIAATKVGVYVGGIIGAGAGPIGAIIGGVVGAILGAAMFGVIGGVNYLYMKHKKKKMLREQHGNQNDGGNVVGNHSQSKQDLYNSEKQQLLYGEKGKNNLEDSLKNEETKDNDMDQNSISILSDITIPEISSGGNHLLEWRQTFAMTSSVKCDEMLPEMDDEYTSLRVEKLNCGHTIEIKTDGFSAHYSHTTGCSVCGKESYLIGVSEHGQRDSVIYAVLFERT